MVIFFFKQKTAYEMRISDWSSDVCSSDLQVDQHLPGCVQVVEAVGELHRAGEEHLAPHHVGPAAVRGVLAGHLEHRADPAGERQVGTQHAGQNELCKVVGGGGGEHRAEHQQVAGLSAGLEHAEDLRVEGGMDNNEHHNH